MAAALLVEALAAFCGTDPLRTGFESHLVDLPGVRVPPHWSPRSRRDADARGRTGAAPQSRGATPPNQRSRTTPLAVVSGLPPPPPWFFSDLAWSGSNAARPSWIFLCRGRLWRMRGGSACMAGLCPLSSAPLPPRLVHSPTSFPTLWRLRRFWIFACCVTVRVSNCLLLLLPNIPEQGRGKGPWAIQERAWRWVCRDAPVSHCRCPV
jgi:hypothetical protein